MRKRKFELYCTDPENIENYEKAKVDDFKDWHCHHRLETHNSDGEKRLVDISRDELIALGIYWHRPSSELIFMTKSEHRSLHGGQMKGKHHTEEAKKKISEAGKGKSPWIKGKHHTEEAKKKMSEAGKGRPAWNKDKKMSEDYKIKLSEAHKGKHLSEEQKKKIGESRKGYSHTDDTKRKMSTAKKGKPCSIKGFHWYNNGKVNTRAKECPDDFVPGRL